MNTNEIIVYDLLQAPNLEQQEYDSFEKFSKTVEEYINYYNN